MKTIMLAVALVVTAACFAGCSKGESVKPVKSAGTAKQLMSKSDSLSGGDQPPVYPN